MHQLTYELKQLADTYREGSYATQHNRRHMLMQMGEQLVAAGYKHLHARRSQGASCHGPARAVDGAGAYPPIRSATASPWCAGGPRRSQKVAILPKDNASYGLPKRQTVARTSKARELPPDTLPRCATGTCG